MIKYLKIFPLIIYPYAYYISYFIFEEMERQGIDTKIIKDSSFIIYNLLVLIILLWSLIVAFKKYTPLEAAKMNLVIKICHIPWYLFYFSMLSIGFTAGPYIADVIGMVIFVFVLNLIIIIPSGVFSFGCVRRIKKEGILSATSETLSKIASFISGLDVFAAIYLVVQCK